MASRSLNKVFLIGNLTRDPELRYTPSGTPVCSIGLATNRTYVTDGEKREETEFHRLVAWNKLAELCSQLLKKGTKIHIEGRLQTRSWQTPDGQPRSTTEIVIEDMMILSPKSGETADLAEMADKSFADDVAQSQEEPAKAKVEDKKKAVKKEEKTDEAGEKEEPKKVEDIDIDDLDIPF